jgi:hypothetical protein
MATRNELQDKQGPKTTQRQQEIRGEGTGDRGRKSSQLSEDRTTGGNAGSHQGDRDTSAPPAPGQTRGEERDRKNR